MGSGADKAQSGQTGSQSQSVQSPGGGCLGFAVGFGAGGGFFGGWAGGVVFRAVAMRSPSVAGTAALMVVVLRGAAIETSARSLRP